MDIINILIGAMIGAGSYFVFFTKGAGASLPFNFEQKPAQAVDPQDLEVMARTIWGEARGEGREGMQAVANVIMNRFELAQQSLGYARQFGATIQEICQKPYQFSVWNANDPNLALIQSVNRSNPQFRQALNIAEKALRGNLPDITGGADHYHTAAVSPNWSQGETPVKVIKSHKFFRLA